MLSGAVQAATGQRGPQSRAAAKHGPSANTHDHNAVRDHPGPHLGECNDADSAAAALRRERGAVQGVDGDVHRRGAAVANVLAAVTGAGRVGCNGMGVARLGKEELGFSEQAQRHKVFL